MRAYKCDVCGKYVDDCYAKGGMAFDIFECEAKSIGLATKHVQINEFCEDCYQKINTYIHNLYKQNHGIEVNE